MLEIYALPVSGQSDYATAECEQILSLERQFELKVY